MSESTDEGEQASRFSEARQFHQDCARRLKQARIDAGFASAQAFAAAAEVNAVTYHHHENGRRVPDKWLWLHYADVLHVAVGWLLFGETTDPARDIPIVGIIGAGGVIRPTRTERAESSESTD